MTSIHLYKPILNYKLIICFIYIILYRDGEDDDEEEEEEGDQRLL